MYKVLVSDPISDFGLQQLAEAKDVELTKQTGLSEQELIEIIGDYDALLVRSQTKVTPAIMEAGVKLKAIGRAGVGVDNIDLDAATKQGIIVINAPDGNTITTCEHTFAMLLSLARHIPQAYRRTVEGVWDRKSFLGVELRGKKLGVIGLGRIGIEVAQRAQAFGMSIIGYDPFISKERAEKLGITLATVDELASEADFITVHTPLTKDTRHIISTAQFKLMKKGIRIVNCARGGIIDEAALLVAIEEGIVAGAAFDVFEQEPPAADHPFLNNPNIIVTPHLGASTVEAQENVAIDVSEQILHILRSEPFKNAVNMPLIPADQLRRLQPYCAISEKLGSALAQMTDGVAQEVTLFVSGELADLDTSLLVRHALKGILTHHLGDGYVNIVNSVHLAKQRHIDVAVNHSLSSQDVRGGIMVKLKTDVEERWITGSAQGDNHDKIVRVGPYPVDIAAEGNFLLISQLDQPGIIGRVGTLLGDYEVNIGTMQVGRTEIGGSAVMILTVDKRIPETALEALQKLESIKRVRMISLD